MINLAKSSSLVIMNDEDQEDLLIQVSESDTSSAESEAYLDDGRVIPFVQQNEENSHQEAKYCIKKRIEFVCSGAVLLVASTVLLILVPIYSDSVNGVADVYTLVLFTSAISTMILLVWTYLCSQTKLFQPASLPDKLKPPFRFSILVQAGLAQGIGGLLVIFSTDSKKVLCHLQDPIKATTLVFALVFYFLFSRKLMGLQRIFCTTTMIVGLFVCLDYGLCDEFRCRGWEREQTEDDTGQWKRAVHFVAGSAYLAGLALWTFHFFLVETGVTSLQLPQTDNTKQQTNSPPTQTATATAQPAETNAKPSALVLASWIHVVSLTVTMLLFWVDMLPYVGKASSWDQLTNLTRRGLLCHVGLDEGNSQGDCGFVPLLGWIVAAVMAVFSVSASNVLVLSQSAVLTVAVTTSALPLGNLFWSFFRLPPSSGGVVEWWPTLSAELVCTLVGLPIVGAGLYLLCRSQFSENGPQREPCCTLRFHQRSAPPT